MRSIFPVGSGAINAKEQHTTQPKTGSRHSAGTIPSNSAMRNANSQPTEVTGIWQAIPASLADSLHNFFVLVLDLALRISHSLLKHGRCGTWISAFLYHLIFSGWLVESSLTSQPWCGCDIQQKFQDSDKSRMPYSKVVQPIVKYHVHQSRVQFFCHSSLSARLFVPIAGVIHRKQGHFSSLLQLVREPAFLPRFSQHEKRKNNSVETTQIVCKVGLQVKHPDLARGGGKDSRKDDSWDYRWQRKCFWKVGLEWFTSFKFSHSPGTIPTLSHFLCKQQGSGLVE